MADKPDTAEPEGNEPPQPGTLAYRLRRRRIWLGWLMIAFFAIVMILGLLWGDRLP